MKSVHDDAQVYKCAYVRESDRRQTRFGPELSLSPRSWHFEAVQHRRCRVTKRMAARRWGSDTPRSVGRTGLGRVVQR